MYFAERSPSSLSFTRQRYTREASNGIPYGHRVVSARAICSSRFRALCVACVVTWSAFRGEVVLDAQETSASGPVAAYALSEGGDIVASDSSGNGNNATLYNSPIWLGEGRFGSALSFDDLDAMVLPDNGSLTLANAFTFEAWINPADVTRWGGLWYGKNIYLYTSSNAGLQASVNVGGGVWKKVVAPGGSLRAGVWTHIALTFDGSILVLYVDGVPAGWTPASGRFRQPGAWPH